MCNARTGVALLLIIITEVASTGKFKLGLLEFSNDKGILNDRSCCAGPEIDNSCTSQCKTYFKICLKPYQVDITDGNCAFGEFVTDVLGNNSFGFPGHQGAFTNPLVFNVDFSWPGDFTLIIDAYHEASDPQGQEQLIGSFRGSSQLIPAHGAVNQLWNNSHLASSQTLRFTYQIECDESFFGDRCVTVCTPRDDDLGHYECGANGEKVCKQGWEGDYCTKAICLEGCSAEHGECSSPNECRCRIGWTGRFCNECEKYPNCENGFCTRAFECICKPGWGGLYCNQDLNYCTHNTPCQNGGTCTNTGEGSYTCSCPLGFTGTNCETEIDNCSVQPCENNGVCEDVGNDYQCTCPSGFAGSRCEIDAARCRENPCAHGGTCEPVGDSYRCRCADGWTGVNCQQEVDECMVDGEPLCQNGGHCVDGHNSFTCECPAGYTGQFCQTNIDDCAGSNPCLNGGVCVDGEGRFECRCRAGFQGALCEQDIDDCLTRPCANGGTCRDKVNDFQCLCAPGFSGRMCSEQVNLCNQHRCRNGATCVALVNAFECHCTSEYEGDLCQYRAGQAPSTTTTARRQNAMSRATLKSNAQRSGKDESAITKTGRSSEQNDENVSLTQPELILIICLSGGIPICLLFILVTILLCRRCRRQVGNNDKSEEAMNNKINNQVVANSGKPAYEYPTTEKKVSHDMESPVPVHQIPLDYKNSAAAQPATTKVVHKEMIKNINRVKELNLSKSSALVAPSVTQPSALTVAEQQQYSMPYYQQERLSNIATPTLQTSHRSSSQNTNSNSTLDNPISTVCDTVLSRKGSQHVTPSINSNSTDYNSHSLQPTFRHSQEEHSLRASQHYQRPVSPLPQEYCVLQNTSASETHYDV